MPIVRARPLRRRPASAGRRWLVPARPERSQAEQPAVGADGRPITVASLPPEEQPDARRRSCRRTCAARRWRSRPTSRPAPSSSIRPTPISISCSATARRCATASASAATASPGPAREKITRKAEWPDWFPPAEMIERQPYLPRFMAGGAGQSARRPRDLSRHDASTASTAPTSLRRSARSCRPAASACSTRTSPICSTASRSAPASWCCRAVRRREPRPPRLRRRRRCSPARSGARAGRPGPGHAADRGAAAARAGHRALSASTDNSDCRRACHRHALFRFRLASIFRSASPQASLRGSSLPLVKASIASTICP